jgi:quinol-cytochrome oxidoreductase complex cytochrome b subunit
MMRRELMSDIEHSKPDTIPFYPDHVRTEFFVVLGVLVIVVIIAIGGLIKPVGIGEPADPLNTPTHVKPEWYFLSLYQVLKKIPPMVLGIEGKTLGVVIPILLVGAVILWPFLDTKPDISRKIYRIRMAVVAAVVLVIIALTIWGEVS